MGQIVQYAEREMRVEGRSQLLLDLLLEMDRADVSGLHKVLIQGRQAEELKHFIQAEVFDLPDIMVLGWLRSSYQESLIMAGQVTVLVSRDVRQAAVAAIRQAQGEIISSSEA